MQEIHFNIDKEYIDSLFSRSKQKTYMHLMRQCVAITNTVVMARDEGKKVLFLDEKTGKYTELVLDRF